MIRRLFTVLILATLSGAYVAPAHAVFLEAERLYSLGDTDGAIRAFEKRGSEGDGEALYTLGEIYARGVDVQLDLAAAYKWMCLASLKQVKFADRKVGILTGPLTHAQIRKANDEAEEWLDDNPQGVPFKSCYNPGDKTD